MRYVPRFRMRKLLAVITVGCLILGGWVTYQRHWIALRRAALAHEGQFALDLGDLIARQPLIHTVRGVGYRLGPDGD